MEASETLAALPFRPLFYQRWSDLLFMHWPIAPELLQRRLPKGLVLETFDGTGWIGVIPFVLSRARPAGFVPIPFLSSFHELNMRTYVRDAEGRSGVWFFSLEASSALAVFGARSCFHLNYQHADFRLERRGDEEIVMDVRRREPDAPVMKFHYTWEPGKVWRAAPGSLDAFLVERYRLFSVRARDEQLCTCEIAHAPYRLMAAQALLDGRQFFSVNGFPVPESPPAHVVAAMPVDVATDRLRHLEPEAASLAQSSAVAAS